MEIKLNDNYVLTSDTYNYILNKITVNKNKNETYLVPIAYYGTIEKLIYGLFENKIKTCELDNLNDIKALITNATCEMATKLTEVINNEQQ